MSDYCGGCRFDPAKRLGPDACPFTAGYWAWLDRNAERLEGERRMSRPLSGLRRLADRTEVVRQERHWEHFFTTARDARTSRAAQFSRR